MNTQYRDPWQRAVDQDGGIEGAFLKCTDGRWLLDGFEIPAGDDGSKVCFIMSEAMHGRVRWKEGKIAERVLRRYAEIEPEADIPDGWNPYTSCLGVVITGESGIGQLVTLAGSSWAVRSAFTRLLLKPYVRLCKRQFPIATLHSTPRKNDANSNVDPVFKVIGWRPRSAFADMLGEAAELERLAPPAASVAPPIDADPDADRDPDDFDNF
jgi:hypothetical protein